MRFLFPVAMALAATASAQPGSNPEPLPMGRGLLPGSNCPNATSHMAGRDGVWQSDPVKPRKLGELPPADSYAAVYQLDAQGCMVPVKYRAIQP